jgi:hypothetical protein
VHRRRYVSTIGATAVGLSLAGCLGLGGGEEETNTPADTDAPSNTGSEETDTPDVTDTPESNSLFANYGIDGERLVVELTESALGQVSEIRLETPSGEKTADVGQTITEYSLDILRDRAGNWLIDALDMDGGIIETAELETTFMTSVDDIGTFSQLDVTASSPFIERTNYQLTVTNTGDVPIEPSEIEFVVPNIEFFNNSIGGDEMDEYSEDPIYKDGIVDRDGESVILADDDNTYAFMPSESVTDLFVDDEEDLNELAGQSFQGEFVIRYRAEREETVVPVTIEMGTEIITDSGFSRSYLSGNIIDKR